MEIISTEAELIESNKLFFNVVENSSIGMILIDIDTTKFHYVNKSFLKYFGYTKEEVIGKTSLELNIVLPEFREKILAELKKQIDVQNIEIIVKNKNGKPFWALASFQIITILEKKYTLTSFIDISDWKKTETKLAQLASIIKYSDDAIIRKSTKGIIESWNIGAEKMFGYTAEEATGKNISIIIPEEYMNEEIAILQTICKDEAIKHYETIRTKRNGENFYVSLTVSPIKDDKGVVTGVSKMIRDETERKKAEDQNKLKDAFLSIISHEIRTPLNAIMGFSDILYKRKLGEQEKEYVGIIKRSGEDLLLILNDIIDMSKLEAGTITLEEKKINIKSILNSIEELIAAKANKKNLELIFNCDDDVPAILFGDQTRLTQIIVNLVTNAIKFTEKGTINVSAQVLNNDNKNSLLKFTVKDSGTGIPPAKLLHIFDRFRQVESHNNRKQGGIGLGLSITKRLVELQGGILKVESIVNEGSTFTVSLPFKK